METTIKFETLPKAKIDEWYQWGKDAYKGTASLMRGNSHHPDYDTIDKREAVHDTYGDSYMLKEERKQALIIKWGYSPEAIKEAITAFKKGYDASRAWYKKADAKQQAVLDSYAPIFKQAEEIARKVDVSDIQDSFPCGSAHVYLDYADRDTLLGKALGHFNTATTMQYKYRLPINMPSYGQCIAFDERICAEVVTFLRSKGVMANVYSWID